MLARMPASLMAEWAAFDQVEPISLGWRGDAQAALVAQVIANVYRNPKVKKTPFGLDEFMLRYGEPQAADPEEVWMKVKTWAERYKQ